MKREIGIDRLYGEAIEAIMRANDPEQLLDEAKLTKLQKSRVKGRYVGGDSNTVIAERQSVVPGVVNSSIAQGLHKVTKYLRRRESEQD